MRLGAPLNLAQALQVQAQATLDGPAPRVVRWRGRWLRVVAVDDSWLVDDEWWRDEISRGYFVVRIDGDVRATLFVDRLAGSWWAQRA